VEIATNNIVNALSLTTSYYFSDCNSIENDPYFRRKSFFK